MRGRERMSSGSLERSRPEPQDPIILDEVQALQHDVERPQTSRDGVELVLRRFRDADDRVRAEVGERF